MRRITKQASLVLALALAVAAFVPTVGTAYVRTGSGSGDEANGQANTLTERTPTELAQRQSTPVSATSITERTPTELAQRQSTPVSTNLTPTSSPAAESGGFDWGDAAIGAGAVLALGLSSAAIVAVARRQRRSTPSLGAVRS
jgi:hypothetical protein